MQNPNRYEEASARQVRPWLSACLADVAPQAASLTVRFVSDREMRRLNRSYRDHDRSTDVLSFPGDLAEATVAPPGFKSSAAAHLGDARLGDAPLGDAHLGDIVIAVPTARRQATSLGHSVERELRVLMLHGLLHCLGYDHETDDGTMERLERKLQRQWIDHE